jgi:hypothetical protein
MAAQAKSFSQFFPQFQQEFILIISRNRKMAFQITENIRNIISIGRIDEDHALKLL